MNIRTASWKSSEIYIGWSLQTLATLVSGSLTGEILVLTKIHLLDSIEYLVKLESNSAKNGGIAFFLQQISGLTQEKHGDRNMRSHCIHGQNTEMDTDSDLSPFYLV